MNAAYEELRRRLAEISDLRSAAMLLVWDQETMMPRGGTAARADQLATLERITHERFTSAEIGLLLDRLRPYEERLARDSDEAALIRVTRRDWEKACRVPAALQAELAHAAAEGHQAWADARATSDYARFRPALQRNLDLRRRYVECFEDFDDPYDVLLDDYEPGMTTSEAEAVLERLREALVPVIAEVAAAEPVEVGFLAGPFPIERQRQVERAILDRVGFDPASWRLDEILHPMQITVAIGDIRISTRYSETSLETVFSCLHEFGHGLYERQVDPALARTPLEGGASLGLHESQSRLWENLVGRGMPFWRAFYPLLQGAFPEPLGGVPLDAFHRAVNKVEPSLIRVDADQLTYNLHILLRFELERKLLAGTLAVSELPEAWNAGMEDYLGVSVPDDARGVLQDSHWSSGGFGYFATYSLGNVVSVQLWERARADLPDLDEQIEAGEFGALRGWLAAKVHRHGRKYMPGETLERAAGGAIDPEPYVRYLRAKVAEIYGVVPAR